MFEDVLDVVDKFAKDNNIVLVGIMLLVAAFVLSFCYKTFWGQWKDRTKKKQIYGTSRRGVSHLQRKPRKNSPKNKK